VTWERAAKIIEYADFRSGDMATHNRVFEGLKVIARHCDDIEVTAEHDQIWAHIGNSNDITKFSEGDILDLARLNWWVDEYIEAFSKFV
jgi:hypothetical protein